MNKWDVRFPDGRPVTLPQRYAMLTETEQQQARQFADIVCRTPNHVQEVAIEMARQEALAVGNPSGAKLNIRHLRFMR